MRIWDIAPDKLCRNHLLGEHRELHAVWSILTKHKKGYSAHPDTRRWRDRLQALFLRHRGLVSEMATGVIITIPAVSGFGKRRKDPKRLRQYDPETGRYPAQEKMRMPLNPVPGIQVFETRHKRMTRNAWSRQKS